MQRTLFVLIGIGIGFGCLASPGSCEDPPSKSASAAEEEKRVQAILAADSPDVALRGYTALFRSTKAERLRHLQMTASDTIAVQAAWEEIERTIPENPDRVVRPDRDKLARFIGFLEGRGRVQVPEWWADAVLDARANCRGNVYAGGLTLMPFGEAKQKTPKPPPVATFAQKDGKGVVRVGSDLAIIPDDLRDKLKAGRSLDQGLSALITPTRCYVAVYDHAGYPYRLACVDRASTKTRRVAKVWASWWGNASGQHHQYVEVTEQGKRVVVCGIASSGFHVEAFGAEDGVNVLRFSNSYSGR
jgi:hypothetical protein